MSEVAEMPRAEVLEPGEPTMAELAERVNRHHEAGMAHIADALNEWCAAGDALRDARLRCEDGEWSAWLQANCPFSARHANLYMRVVRYRDVLEANPEPITQLKQAQMVLRGLPDETPRGGGQSADPRLVADAKRLRDEGLDCRAIGDLLGRSQATIYRWLNPDSVRRSREADKKRAVRARRAAAALAEKEREQATKRALSVARGKAKAEAYQVVNRLDGLLGQAREEASTQEERRELNEAHKYRDKMMEHLVRALGVS